MFMGHLPANPALSLCSPPCWQRWQYARTHPRVRAREYGHHDRSSGRCRLRKCYQAGSRLTIGPWCNGALDFARLLGLEGQQTAIERFCAAEGYEITRTFVEIETAKGADALSAVRSSSRRWTGRRPTSARLSSPSSIA